MSGLNEANVSLLDYLNHQPSVSTSRSSAQYQKEEATPTIMGLPFQSVREGGEGDREEKDNRISYNGSTTRPQRRRQRTDSSSSLFSVLQQLPSATSPTPSNHGIVADPFGSLPSQSMQLSPHNALSLQQLQRLQKSPQTASSTAANLTGHATQPSQQSSTSSTSSTSPSPATAMASTAATAAQSLDLPSDFTFPFLGDFSADTGFDPDVLQSPLFAEQQQQQQQQQLLRANQGQPHLDAQSSRATNPSSSSSNLQHRYQQQQQQQQHFDDHLSLFQLLQSITQAPTATGGPGQLAQQQAHANLSSQGIPSPTPLLYMPTDMSLPFLGDEADQLQLGFTRQHMATSTSSTPATNAQTSSSSNSTSHYPSTNASSAQAPQLTRQASANSDTIALSPFFHMAFSPNSPLAFGVGSPPALSPTNALLSKNHSSNSGNNASSNRRTSSSSSHVKKAASSKSKTSAATNVGTTSPPPSSKAARGRQPRKRAKQTSTAPPSTSSTGGSGPRRKKSKGSGAELPSHVTSDPSQALPPTASAKTKKSSRSSARASSSSSTSSSFSSAAQRAGNASSDSTGEDAQPFTPGGRRMSKTKRAQNKAAADKYRRRKKEELDHLQKEATKLHRENIRLDVRATRLEDEMSFLRNLLGVTIQHSADPVPLVMALPPELITREMLPGTIGEQEFKSTMQSLIRFTNQHKTQARDRLSKLEQRVAELMKKKKEKKQKASGKGPPKASSATGNSNGKSSVVVKEELGTLSQ